MKTVMYKAIIAIAATSFVGLAAAQTTGTAGSTGTATPGSAAAAAVTPGDQNMGRTPANRTGGVMGSGGTVDRATGTSATERTTVRTTETVAERRARADRN
jgi:hypothetical protein